MNIKTFDDKSKLDKFDLKNHNSEDFHIEIQCPDCGNIFILDKRNNYFCENCNRIYNENEIRTRCGL